MIAGIGVDLCEISRIARAVESEHFRQRVFTPEEIAYSEGKGARRAESYASSFAAREAFVKASGESLGAVMFGGGFWLVRDSEGKPAVRLSGALGEKWKGAKVFVSVSHEGGYACAMIVIEKINEVIIHDS